MARFPVQYVIRPQTADRRPRTAEHPDYRGYAGKIASGLFHVGQQVTVPPSGRTTTIAAIDVLGEAAEIAWAPQSITMRLADDLESPAAT